MSKRVLNVLLGVLSLAFGGMIYLLFRSNSYISRFLGEGYALELLREASVRCYCEFLDFYLADYLWGLSLSCGMIAIFDPKTIGISVCCLTSFLLGVVWETLQFVGAISGTADALDIIMYFFAGITALLINFKETEK